MTDDKPTLKDLLVESMSQADRSLRFHPTLKELAEFRGGNLPQDEESSILEHLGACRECADGLVSCSRQASFQGEQTLWDNVRNWLWPKDHSAPLLAPGLAVVAVLSLVALAASQWQRAQAATSRWQLAQQAVAALSKPQVNVEIFQVRRPIRDLDAETSVFELGPEDHRFLMVLPVAGGYENYELRVLDVDGREVWKSRELRPDDLGLHVRLELSRHFLEPGSYFFEISGLKGGEPESTVEHRVSLKYS